MTNFRRSQAAELADDSISMPSDELGAATTRITIGELIGNYENHRNDPDYGPQNYPWAKGFAMGFPLPSFQRDQVWTLEQKRRFITSIWAGVDLGTYMINDLIKHEPNSTRLVEFSQALLDGQQRLTCIQQYITDEFAVPDATGTPRYWRELGIVERRRFFRTTFTMATIQSYDEAKLRRAYDLRAFGGTAHKESERASV